MENKKIIIDVRTPEEYVGGCCAESINIPLNEIEKRVDEIKKMNHPIILCCASGIRSGQATAFLKSLGIDCQNGGSWVEVNNTINKN
ncbi:MAG: rhodanese-like domain-containing protein [Chitinophagaceae bacterium]|nr:rhodanese-like domain-containing protein [Chitinophagaceae bacterium]MCW5906068.1 rhodanese-like domain-containing protein [Chitinophagaceae bacterium]